MNKSCKCEKEEISFRLKIIRISITSILIFLAATNLLSFIPALYLFVLAYAVISYDVIIETIENIIHGKIFDESFLMVVATVCAFLIREYSEAVLVMLLYQVGELLEDIAVDSGRRSIEKLLNIKSESAHLIYNDTIREVSVEDIAVDDVLIVKVGEKIPVDGIIIDGNTSLDVSSLTGEYIPVDKIAGETVLSGSINLSAVIKIKVLKSIKESTTTKILEFIKESEESKSNSERFIARFAKIYTPFVVFIAFLIAIVPLFFGESFSVWGYRACIFLVVSCPCALVISVPLSFFVGIAKASKLGVLFKGSNHLENLNRVNLMLFDKTGTLTTGKLEVVKVVGSEDILEKAYIAESMSNHPIAKTINDYYGKTENFKIENHKEIAGMGTSVIYNGKEIRVGKNDFVINSQFIDEDGTVIHVSYGDKYLGYIVIKDSIKQDTKQAISELKTDVAILTGDNYKNAENTAKKLNISKFYANLLPIDKVNIVKQHLKEGKKVAFVGDGINDSPVLSSSTVGISMGGIGSDAAIEASDIVIMNDNISSIVKAKKVSKITMKKAYQNITIILIVKLAAMILGIFDVLPIWGATIADVGVCLLTILNALTIFGKKIGE